MSRLIFLQLLVGDPGNTLLAISISQPMKSSTYQISHPEVMRGLDLNVRSETKDLLRQLDDTLRVRPHRAGAFVHEAGQR